MDSSPVSNDLWDVLEALLDAYNAEVSLHGWGIVKTTRLSTPSVYDALDELEVAHWIQSRWETPEPHPKQARRRLYDLTPTGLAVAESERERRRAVLRQRLQHRWLPRFRWLGGAT